MKCKKIVYYVYALTLGLCSASVFAHEEHEHEHRQYGVHVHGEAEINILIDKNTITFELQTPANNILGFEHAPETAEEKMKLKEAAIALTDYRSVLTLSGVDCEQINADLELPFSDIEMHKEDSGHHHDEDGHEHTEMHSEYHLYYSLNCEDTSKLRNLEVTLFEHYPGFEQVDVKWSSQSGSGAKELLPDNKSVYFR